MIWNNDTEKTIGISREEKYGRSKITYVEIVRCKDCKHFEPDGIYTMCYRHNGLSQNAEWFCADGRKRDEN